MISSKSVRVFGTIAPLLMIAVAAAQETPSPDDVKKGHDLAVLICSNCHVAAPDQRFTPVLQPPAPSFESIAQRNSLGADTIESFISTTHRGIDNPAGMPNPQLLGYQVKQVAAYLLSLRKKP